ncbi:MAG: hypothetical protein HYV29_06580 [Ignavibacteriales bacterium]|nr:hypothetical protein [Ignavibacteriales bacterium]
MVQFPLIGLLHSAYDGSISAQDLARLIFFCRGVCESHVRTFRPYIVSLCQQEKISLSDLAYECIAPVFALDGNKRYFRIRAFVDELPNPLKKIDEMNLFIIFRSFLSSIINVEIAKYHVELDPVGAKILRGLKLAVKHSATAHLSENIYGIVLELSDADAPERTNEFPIELLERKLVVRNAMFKENPAFIQAVAAIMNEQDEYRRSVLLYDLVVLRKKYLQTEEKELLNSVMTDSSLDHLFSHYEINRMREQTLRFVRRKANTMYADTRKLDTPDITVLINTMESIINRWFAGDGHKKQYMEHVRQHHPVTKEEYDLHWKTRVEYLVKLAKTYIAEKIQK